MLADLTSKRVAEMAKRYEIYGKEFHKMRKKYYDKIRLVKVRPRTDRALVLKGTFENPC